MRNTTIADKKGLAGNNLKSLELIKDTENTIKEGQAKHSLRMIRQITVKLTFGILLVLLVNSSSLFAQDAKTNPDNALKGSGRVNPSTLAMELDIPMGNYPGRGINVPISLSYSSKLWRIDTVEQLSTSLGGAQCHTYSYPRYSEDTKSGWNTSLEAPTIEYTGWLERFTQSGFPVVDRFCEQGSPPPVSSPVKRITVRLPSGETHELRGVTQTGSNRDGYYYAADGSNLVYSHDSYNNVYKLLMPDGSFYLFDTVVTDLKTAFKFTDRNGNHTDYNSTSGQWTDTIGRTLESPLKVTSVGTHTYTMPGMTGSYKFKWENLGDGLTNPSDQLKYPGDTYQNGNSFNQRSATDTLFQSNGGWTNRVTNSYQVHNPTVLTEIELPTGQKYEFSYDIYGRINKIKYPTGGEETFTYEQVEPLTPITQPWEDVSSQANVGVATRTLSESTGGASYQWDYDSTFISPEGYKVSITNPEGILIERFLISGEEGCIGCSIGNYGYSDILVGRAYETRVFDAGDEMVSRQLTHWTKNSTPVGNGTNDWSPRITHEENYTYDPSGNGDQVWTTTKYEYEDTSSITKPLLKKKTLQYNYQGAAGGSSLIPPEQPGGDPDPNPTPIPTPQPPSATLIKTIEVTHMIYDTSIAQATRDIYRNLNMVGLITATEIKDGAGTVVSRRETAFDEGTYSPAIGRGNPTTARVWDSSKGVVTNSANYVLTKAKFDNYGNRIESIDALNRVKTTTYDSTYNAFPVKLTTPIPGNGTNGSSTAFETETTYNFTTGLPITKKNANGQITTFEYDPVTVRLKKITPPAGGGVSEIIYNDTIGNVWTKNRSQIDANSWAETITYFDGLGRAYKSEQVHSDGDIITEKEFDSVGRVYRTSNPYRSGETKVWTTNTYDNAGRVIEILLADGAKILTDYSVSTSGKIGTTKQVTDQAGKKRKGINDALGRMIRVIEDPDNQNLETDYIFDTLGNLRKTTQGEQNRYFMHNSLGRLLYSKQPEEEANTSFTATDPITNNTNWSNKYNYDDNGNITSTTNAYGVTVTATYDNFNRVIFRNYSDSTPNVNFYYDGTGLGAVPNYSKGKLTKTTSIVSETRYTSFDNQGRLLTHEQRTTAGQLAGTETGYQTAYAYNLSGGLLTETYPSGKVINHSYRQDGELDKISGTEAGETTANTYLDNITYNTQKHIEKMRLGNGNWENIEYNLRQQVSQIALGHSNTDKGLLKIDYDYGQVSENNGSLRQQKISYVGLSHEIVQDYTYDDLNRLKSATESSNSVQSWKQTFNYDRYGNREFDAANTTTLPANDKVNNPEILTSNNRLKEDQDGDSVIDYDYDKAGNLTLDAEAQRFIYDAENRIKEFFKGTNQGATADATYEYDGDGKRVRKVVDGIETIFVYNANGKLVAEYSDELPTIPKISYLTEDHLGSPRIITDGGGAVVSRHDYLAFGNEVTSTVGNVAGRTNGQGYGVDDDIRKQYTGYERDEESGLNYAQARYYNPTHGRFTSVDPLTASASIKNPQTFNRYSYVLNSPYKFTDPLGLLPSNGSSWFGTSDNGFCPAESSQCSGDSYDPWADRPTEEEETDQENETDSQEDEENDGGKQDAEEAETPPSPTDDDPGPEGMVADVLDQAQKAFRDRLIERLAQLEKAGVSFTDAAATLLEDFINSIADIKVTIGAKGFEVTFPAVFLPKNLMKETGSGLVKEINKINRDTAADLKAIVRKANGDLFALHRYLNPTYSDGAYNLIKKKVRVSYLQRTVTRALTDYQIARDIDGIDTSPPSN